MEEYSIREARPSDLETLPRVEHAASLQFLDTSHPDIALEAPTSVDEFRRWMEQGALFVAVNPADEPIGFAFVHELDGQGYLHEIDVDPAQGRRGIGRRLIQRACAWAAQQGFSQLTLSTFEDVPWNAPFYRRLGFKSLAVSEAGPGLRDVRERERAAGLCVERRVFMRLTLESPMQANGGTD